MAPRPGQAVRVMERLLRLLDHSATVARFAVAVVLTACSLGCGDSDIPPPSAPIPIPFSDPSAFDRGGCAPGSLAGFDPTGIWHYDNVIVDVAAFASVTRFDQGAGLEAKIFGRPAQVSLTNDDLFTRVEYEARDGDDILFAYDACAVTAEGALDGKFAYCSGSTCYTGSFHAVRVERIAGEAESSGVELVSEHAGDSPDAWGDGITVNVRVSDGIAYLARYGDGLRIVDVVDPASPHDLGGAPVERPDDDEIYNDVKIVRADERRYALMASNWRGIVAYDVTDPTAPVEVSHFPEPPEGKDRINVHTLFTETTDAGTLAYLADTSLRGIRIYDVTDPRAPKKLGAYVHPESSKNDNAFVHDLYIDQGKAYLCAWDLGLLEVDATDPAQPELVGSFRDYERRTNHSTWVTEVGERRIAVTGDEDWGAHVRMIDVGADSEARFTEIGALSLRPEVSVHNIMAFGDRGYVAWYQDGFRLLDLSNPTQPTVAAYFNTWDGRRGDSFFEGAVGIDVDLDAGLVYIADSERGLLVLKLNP